MKVGKLRFLGIESYLREFRIFRQIKSTIKIGLILDGEGVYGRGNSKIIYILI